LFGGVGSSSAYGSANMGGDGGGTSGSGGLSMSGNFSTNCCWKNKEVVIEGIDRAVWRAFVSATTGRVYFLHLPTNLKQEVVPPGFADNDDYTGPFASLPAAQEQEAFSMDTLEASVQSRVPLAPPLGLPTSPIMGRFPPLDAPQEAQPNIQTSYTGNGNGTAFGSSGGGGSSRWTQQSSAPVGDGVDNGGASDAAVAGMSDGAESDSEL